MPPLILHHYPMSPFAEKARLLLGFKQLAWSSVLIPPIMPKPDVMALTGGYRRTPILQIGADIYCDTALIADVLERLAPAPSLYPPGLAGATRIQAQWADSTLFWHAVIYAMQPAGVQQLFAGVPAEVVQAFGADRATFRQGAPRVGLLEASHALQAYVGRIEDQLGDGRDWLLGAAPSLADFSAYHPLWFVKQAGNIAGVLDPPRLHAWMQRMAGIGHGRSDKLDSGAAIAIAASAPRIAPPAELHALPGFSIGDAVCIAPSDYGSDPMHGQLAAASAHEFIVRRHDPRAGELLVHFPRIGYHIKPRPQDTQA